VYLHKHAAAPAEPFLLLAAIHNEQGGVPASSVFLKTNVANESDVVHVMQDQEQVGNQHHSLHYPAGHQHECMHQSTLCYMTTTYADINRAART
jgi:hypothetical protein